MNWLTDIRKYYLFRAAIKRFVLPIQVIYLLDSGLTVLEIGYIASICAVISLVMEIPSGTISDVIGHKKALVIASLFQGLSMFLFILSSGFVGFLIASIVYWGPGTLLTGTMEAFLFEFLERQKKQHLYKRYYGRAYAVANSVSIISMISASALYFVHPHIPFYIGVAQFIIAALAIGSIRYQKNHLSVEEEEGYLGFWESVKKNKQLLSPSKPLLWIGLHSAIFFAAIFSLAEFYPIYLENVGIPVVLIGSVIAARRLVVTFSSLAAEKVTDTLGEVNTLWMIFFVDVLLLLGLGLSTNPWVSAGFLVCMSLFYGIAVILARDLQNQLLTSGSRSSFLSLFMFWQTIIKAGLLLLVGLLANLVSLHLSFAIVAAIFFVLLLPIILRIQKTYTPKLS